MKGYTFNLNNLWKYEKTFYFLPTLVYDTEPTWGEHNFYVRWLIWEGSLEFYNGP